MTVDFVTDPEVCKCPFTKEEEGNREDGDPHDLPAQLWLCLVASVLPVQVSVPPAHRGRIWYEQIPSFGKGDWGEG